MASMSRSVTPRRTNSALSDEPGSDTRPQLHDPPPESCDPFLVAARSIP